MDGLEQARRMVSEAEARALEQAEELRLEAERLLKAAQHRHDGEVSRAGDDVTAQLAAVRSELEDVARRAGAAEEELSSLRTENATLRARLEAATAGPDDRQEGPETAKAREDAMRILAAAAREAEDLLTTAVETIERETAAAADLRRQADADFAAAGTARAEAAAEREAAAEALAQARSEAERIIDRARQESEELQAAAREEFRSEMAALRRQFASEVSTLRQAMDRARDSVEQILASEQQVS